MKLRKLIVYATLAVGLGTLTAAHAGNHKPPSAAEIAFAEESADLMTNTVIAALLQEIDETTPDNVAQGSLSISLVFNDKNHDMRLVGTIDPLSGNDYPEDDFEEDALESAMVGMPATAVDRVKGKWYYRRSIPLSNFAPQCAMCHESFAAMAPTDWVGALMLRVPIDHD